MDRNITTLEQAFQLARSGTYASLAEVKKRLKAEGYSVAPINGGALSKQLNALIQAAQR